jgi:recombination protein RecA
MSIDVDGILEEIGADFVVSKLDDPETLARVDTWISTGNLVLDKITRGGFPVRRITEIYGENSSAKTLLATEAVISTQEMGGLAVYADIEVALGVERMMEIGVDGSQLIYFAPNGIDEVLRGMDAFIDAKNAKLGKDAILTFVWDSVAALVTQDELEEKSYEKQDYPRAAIYLSAAMRKIKHRIAENNVCLILVNQTRQKLGQMMSGGVSTYGGSAIGFYSSLRFEMQNIRRIQDSSKNVVGRETKATVVKSRLSPPWRSAVLPVYFDEGGVDEAGTVFNTLLAEGMLEHTKGSSWYALYVNEEPVKFQRANFAGVFDAHYDYIGGLLDDHYG